MASEMLSAMGFTEIQINKAIAERGDNPEAAADFIMSNMDQSDEWWLTAPAPAPAAALDNAGAPDDAGDHAEVLSPFLDKFKVASRDDQVYKEECVYSCARPTSEHGLYVGLETFLSVGEQMLKHHCGRTNESVFLNITKRRKPKTELPEGEQPAVQTVADAIAQSSKEAKVEYDETLSLVLMPEGDQRTVIPLNDAPLLPGKAQRAIDAVLNANDVGVVADLGEWKPDIRTSRYADALEQVPTNGVVQSCNPADWKCSTTGQTIGKGEAHTESLWLNLSDGFIGGGRRNWDGSGGNNTALDHYAEMKALGKEYPLAVKLGTITAEGDGAVGDVFSYAADEDDMVLDPKLKEHLAHWGVDAAALEKTEKSMAEMELDLNQNREWGRVLEDGQTLEPAYGPGLTGLINMGNTCYMNSVLQLLFSAQPFVDAYNNQELVLSSASPTTDLRCQLAKFAGGLLSGNHSAPQPDAGQPDEVFLRPKMLKMLVADGHADFKTGQQQDAVEYLYHLLSRMRVVEKGAGSGKHLEGAFEYWEQDRLECNATHKVKYNTNEQALHKVFNLEIPMHLAKNQLEFEAYTAKCDQMKKEGGKCEDKAVVRLVEFQEMLQHNMQDEVLADAGTSGLTKRKRFATFPPYLLVHPMREALDPATHNTIKLEVNVPMPESMDLSAFRGTGLQPGEVELEDAPTSAPAPACDQATVTQLVDMGFPEVACRKAVTKTGNNGAEAAMAWLMEHMEDADFAVPEAAPAAAGDIDEAAVSMLMGMGFERPQCVKALQQTGGDQERAVDWIFSHPDDAGGDEAPTSVSPADGSGQYNLVGFVSHIGKDARSGHYVAHIKKDGRWVLFNDEKVAFSQLPPLDCGSLYMYQQQ